ncbi:MAG TPA: trypsin-like serine protease [Pseudolabrys sp.]|nr:trypsin-like serine protease [Pseudolabrys sp.]
MRRLLPALAALVFCAPAYAITGNAPAANGWSAQAIVMVTDPRGDLCTGTALAPDLVLTAAHCLSRKRDNAIRIFQNGETVGVQTYAVHPQFDFGNYLRARATADLALLKLAAPLPDIVVPAMLAPARRVSVGEKLVIAGFGVTLAGTKSGLGIPRAATLTVTGRPGSLQIRLVDDTTRNKRNGLGACTGDSGGPVFELGGASVIGVVSWSTAPNDEEGCGGLTGVTPLVSYHDWIEEMARKFNSGLLEPGVDKN